jgi:hypothetical protein
VGFKAVFQYTKTPCIYDPNFRFRIERFIVPIRIEDDFPGRKPDETLFVFPFNHPDRTRDEACEDISDKLRSLIYPVLFLTHLKEIRFCSSKVSGAYTKNIDEEHRFGDIAAQLITLGKNIEDNEKRLVKNRLCLFTRTSEKGHTYSVGFFFDDKDGALKSSNFAAFCFFPTKEVTGLNFIVHAPFLLTDSREGIKAGGQDGQHNRDMIKLLSELAADSLVCLRDLGQRRNAAFIDDHIVDIIPYDESKFNDVNDKNKISFKPFYID